MKVSEIYEQLDEIRSMVEQNANPDGTIDIDETMAGSKRYISEWMRKHPEFEDDDNDTYDYDEEDDDY